MTLFGFPYDADVEERIKAGEVIRREWKDVEGRPHRTSLFWNERLGCPAVTTLRTDLALRVLGSA